MSQSMMIVTKCVRHASDVEWFGFYRYALRRERAKLKRALQKAEWMERLAAKEARNKAIEEEEARKIPYEVCGCCSCISHPDGHTSN